MSEQILGSGEEREVGCTGPLGGSLGGRPTQERRKLRRAARPSKRPKTAQTLQAPAVCAIPCMVSTRHRISPPSGTHASCSRPWPQPPPTGGPPTAARSTRDGSPLSHAETSGPKAAAAIRAGAGLWARRAPHPESRRIRVHALAEHAVWRCPAILEKPPSAGQTRLWRICTQTPRAPRGLSPGWSRGPPA